MREQLLTICGQFTTGSIWCVTNVTTTHQPHQTLSATMATRTVRPQERETPKSQFHHWESKQRNPGEMASLGLPYWGHLLPIGTALEENQM